MARTVVVTLLVAGLLVAAGCSKKEEGTTPPAVKKTTDQAGDAAEAASADAAKLIEQVQALIKDGKFDDAEAKLKELESQKGSQPADVQKQIEGLRTLLTTSKAAGEMKDNLPKLPG